MSNRQKVLIVSATAPSRCPAAIVATQAALTFQKLSDVTLVIRDQAPPAGDYPDGITVIRERELIQNIAAYASAARLYILDDTFESLFALRLLRKAPGPWINADTTLHELVRADFETREGWPDTYKAFVYDILGETGIHVGHSLTGSMRVSKLISSEIESFDAIGHPDFLLKQSNQELSFPFLTDTKHTDKREQPFTVATIGGGCAEEAVETLKALGKEIRLIQVNGSEPHIADLMEETDAICILDKSYRLPPAFLSCALATGTAVITAGQPWQRHLPANARLTIPNCDALHHLVAAIGSLLGDSPVRSWLKEGSIAFGEKITASHQPAILKDILEAPIQPLELDADRIRQPDKPVTSETKKGSVIKGERRKVALIGAVPPKVFLEQLCPVIDWDNSPRFATVDLAEALSNSTGVSAPILLGLMGYESPLISTEADWRNLQPELKDISEAVTFDCVINGLPKVQSLGSDLTRSPQSLELDFRPIVHEDFKRQTRSGLLEQSGTYWRINFAEQRIDCLIISGMPGEYQLSVETGDMALVIADAFNTNLIKKGSSGSISSDEKGIIQFSIGAAHPVNHFPLTCKSVLKTLATTPLNLEWCSHG